ncbi:hypothetical protein GGR51DRAFT_28628 [Nemania sp. FL0031]|nr:hypothetical protein GGR51DRAFT_28628 [Nemania sp. FL0031]
MATFRDLIAKPRTGLQVLPVDPGSRVTKQRRYHHTPTEWENRRQTIVELYVEKHKTADEVLEILKSEFTFTTGRRQLYNKLKEWGIQKNSRRMEEKSSNAFPDVEDEDIIITDDIADKTLRSSEDAYLAGISFSPLTQYHGTYHSREPTPVASPGFAIQSSQSITSYLIASPLTELPWRDPFSPGAFDFNTPKPPSDNNMNPPWVLTDRLASRSPEQSRLTSVKASRTRSPSLSILPLEVAALDNSPVPLHLSHGQKPVAVEGSSRPSLSDRISLERSLSRVIEFIAMKGCVTSDSKYLGLKKEIKTVLDISQMLEREPGNCISSHPFPPHISLSENLELVEHSIISASRLVFNAGDLNHPSKHLPPTTHIKWQRRFKKVYLGFATLTIEDQISEKCSEESHQLRSVDGTREWYFRTKIVLKPRRSTRALYIEVYHYQIPNWSGPSIPRLSVNNIVPDTSHVFTVAIKGSVQELLDIFARGQANLRDHDQNGLSLLHYSFKNPPMCQFLIEHGLDVDELIIAGSGKLTVTPLILSIEDEQVFRALLAAGADMTIGLCGDLTALHCVYCHDYPESYDMLKLMLDSGEDLGVITIRAIHLLGVSLSSYMDKSTEDGIYDPIEKARLLLDRGSKSRDRCSASSRLHIFFRSIIWTPWRQTLLEELVLLVRRGADVNSRDNYGSTVSEIAYAEYFCNDLVDGGDLGSYRGDLWDAALDLCGEKISEFRKNYPRRARYTALYTRKDFEKLWEGRENSCPYWNDITDPLGSTQTHAPECPESVLCVCHNFLGAHWVNVDDGADTGCFHLSLDSFDSDLEIGLNVSFPAYDGDSNDLEIIEEGAEEDCEDAGFDNRIWQ